jgi:primary-amine oxidase
MTILRSLRRLSLCAVVAAPVGAQDARHPLDALTAAEYRSVVEILRAAGRADSTARYSLVTLREPSKAFVRAWRVGAPVPRAAFAVLREGTRTYEAVIDLVTRAVVSWKEVRGVQATYLEEELPAAGEIALADAAFRRALARRGHTEPKDLFCIGLPPDTPDAPSDVGKRVAQVICFLTKDAVTMPWGRMVDGLTAIVDLDARRVLRVHDEPGAPLPAEYARYDSVAVGRLRASLPPMTVQQPRGLGFRIDGGNVTWDRWRFHVRVDPRVGLVLSLVDWRDGDRWRPVMYEGSLSELFVPYMDASRPFFAFAFMDAGQYSAGGLAKPLVEGADCPPGAVYLDAVAPASDGSPKPVPRAACLFERLTGDQAWRHMDIMTGAADARQRRDLVVRMAAMVGNYDYVFDWTFQPDGAIEVRVGATGVVMTRAVNATTAAGTSVALDGDGTTRRVPNAELAHGRLVAPHVLAVNHDHYFNFRLDLDVDGADNSLVVDRLVTKRLPNDALRRSLWVTEPTVARVESDAKLDAGMGGPPALWRVASASHANRVGYPTSYQLVPGMTATSLLAPDDWPQGRAGFTAHNLWVTPYRDDERYAAGLYPTLSRPNEQGLSAWTRANRPIADRDIVLWYTFGLHHEVRAEDWPVMPVTWHGFTLRPFDFFDRSPSLDLPNR